MSQYDRLFFSFTDSDFKKKEELIKSLKRILIKECNCTGANTTRIVNGLFRHAMTHRDYKRIVTDLFYFYYVFLEGLTEEEMLKMRNIGPTMVPYICKLQVYLKDNLKEE